VLHLKVKTLARRWKF